MPETQFKHPIYGGGTPGVSTDATARAVSGMSIGAIKSWHEMRVRIWQEALDEYDQQYQADITVECNNKVVWLEKDVWFDLVFVEEPTRDSPYTTPVFTYGVEFRSGTPVMFTVMVKTWTRDEQGVSGCRLLIGAVNPGTGKLVKFTGLLHLNFQGFGGPTPDENEDE